MIEVTTYGYVRKNYPDTTSNQLQRIMVHDCQDIFIEEESLENDRELEKLMNLLKKNDQLIVDSIGVLGKSIKDMTVFFERLSEKNVRLISKSDSIDSKRDERFYDLVSILYKVNLNCQKKLTKERIATSQSLGTIFGRPTIDDDIIKRINRLYEYEKLTMREIASQCNVSLGSVHKYLKQSSLL